MSQGGTIGEAEREQETEKRDTGTDREERNGENGGVKINERESQDSEM